jgi:uncharacterized protein
LRVKCHRIVGGQAVGDAIITRQPINFLTMLNAGNGSITDQNHELFGKSVKDTVLVFPKAVGSSVGAYTIYSLKSMNAAPVAVICTEQTDIITASGCAISKIPLVKLTDEVPVLWVQPKLRIVVDADNETLFVNKK